MNDIHGKLEGLARAASAAHAQADPSDGTELMATTKRARRRWMAVTSGGAAVAALALVAGGSTIAMALDGTDANQVDNAPAHSFQDWLEELEDRLREEFGDEFELDGLFDDDEGGDGGGEGEGAGHDDGGSGGAPDGGDGGSDSGGDAGAGGADPGPTNDQLYSWGLAEGDDDGYTAGCAQRTAGQEFDATAPAIAGETWFRAGYRDGYPEAYERGWNDCAPDDSEAEYGEGYEAGETIAFDAGYVDAANGLASDPSHTAPAGTEAFRNGYSAGYLVGYAAGFAEGEADVNAACEAGWLAGDEQGYEDGYVDGFNRYENATDGRDGFPPASVWTGWATYDSCYSEAYLINYQDGYEAGEAAYLLTY